MSFTIPPVVLVILAYVFLALLVLGLVASFLAPRLAKYPRAQAAAMLVAAIAGDALKALVALRQLLSGAGPAITAEQLYEIYNRSADGKNVYGQALPQWDDVPPRIKANWQALSEQVEVRRVSR